MEEAKSELKQLLHDKKKSYAKYVKDVHVPAQSHQKAKELEKELKGSSTAKDLEQLITLKSIRKEHLDNLIIRPNLGSRKTMGDLEIHENGIRFISTKG